MGADMKVDISGLDKADVFRALYERAKPQGMGFLHYDPAPMTYNEAKGILDKWKSLYFDYFKGRVMKVDLWGDELDTALYNRDNGHLAAELVIEKLRKEIGGK